MVSLAPSITVADCNGNDKQIRKHAVIMVGGNLRGHTRVLTTAIVLETGKGEFAPAIALSVILLSLAFMINLTFTWIQQRGSGR